MPKEPSESPGLNFWTSFKFIDVKWDCGLVAPCPEPSLGLGQGLLDIHLLNEVPTGFK